MTRLRYLIATTALLSGIAGASAVERPSWDMMMKGAIRQSAMQNQGQPDATAACLIPELLPNKPPPPEDSPPEECYLDVTYYSKGTRVLLRSQYNYSAPTVRHLHCICKSDTSPCECTEWETGKPYPLGR